MLRTSKSNFASGLQAAIRAQWKKLLLCGLVLAAVLCWPLVSLRISRRVEAKRIALVVLGGGLTATGEVPRHTVLRLEKAKELLSMQALDKEVFIIPLSGGTPHKPNPVDKLGFPITEAKAAARYLVDVLGVNPSQVLEEGFSLDTLGNAYFLRVMHIEPGKFSRLVVITNSWHMARSQAMFSHVFDLPGRAGGRRPTGRRWEIEFVPVAAGLDASTLAARETRERASLATFTRETRPQFSSMRELHSFIFTKHAAYAALRLSAPREALDPKVLATY